MTFFVMVGMEMLRELAGVGGLVEFLFIETDGAGGDGALHQVAHHRHDGGGINAAAEKRAERNIAHQADAGGGAEFVAQALAPFGFGALLDFGEGNIPVGRFADARG